MLLVTERGGRSTQKTQYSGKSPGTLLKRVVELDAVNNNVQVYFIFVPCVLNKLSGT